MTDRFKTALAVEVQDLLDKLTALGNLNSLVPTYRVEPAENEDAKINTEWDAILDRFFDEVADFGRDNVLETTY